MKWVTRERPKIDRIACPWLVTRFIDREPEFLFVPASRVMEVAKETGAIPSRWATTAPPRPATICPESSPTARMTRVGVARSAS